MGVLLDVEVKSRQELRAWLAAHHLQNESIWLITFKKSVPGWYVAYPDIVEEAICFGWIDSRPRSIDEKRSGRLLSPRKAGSAWSRDNKLRAERMIREGKMAPAGLRKVEEAKKDGSWEFLDDVQAGELPADLARALAAVPVAARNFEAFPPSSKRIILEWIKSAKKQETRANRIEETVEKARVNLRANHYRQ